MTGLPIRLAYAISSRTPAADKAFTLVRTITTVQRAISGKTVSRHSGQCRRGPKSQGSSPAECSQVASWVAWGWSRRL
jgi:hypothetical protein